MGTAPQPSGLGWLAGGEEGWGLLPVTSCLSPGAGQAPGPSRRLAASPREEGPDASGYERSLFQPCALPGCDPCCRRGN